MLPAKPLKERIITKVVVWIVFAALLSLTPFVVKLLDLWCKNKLPPEGSALGTYGAALFPHGELLIVSVLLAGEGIGDALIIGPHRQNLLWSKLLAGAGCLFVILMALSMYMRIEGGAQGLHEERLALMSIWLLAVAIIAGAACKALAAAEE